jgi:class 3 adenylate cyclase
VTNRFESLPLPDDPVLAAWAFALNDAGYWATLLDAAWRYAFVTDDLRSSWGDAAAARAVPIGSHWFSAPALQHRATVFRGPTTATAAGRRAHFVALGGYVLASTTGGREELKRVVDPELADLVDKLQPQAFSAALLRGGYLVAGTGVAATRLLLRIDDGDGRIAGVCMLLKPAIGMAQLVAAAATADLAHLERMSAVDRPDRRPAAILMADLEASSPLARRLSSAQYFTFGRRLTRAADQCIVDAGGIVGRHAGDGMVAYFLVETTRGESASARSCIATARNLRRVLTDVAARSDIPAAELSLRFGLQWGATLYIGRVHTAGRSEVTALGDEMNEAARIEACATGGRALASKPLIERLTRTDAQALGLDTAHTKYTALADLSTATDKARRDAPMIAVCEV